MNRVREFSAAGDDARVKLLLQVAAGLLVPFLGLVAALLYLMPYTTNL
jgi:hypothetical protein